MLFTNTTYLTYLSIVYLCFLFDYTHSQ